MCDGPPASQIRMQFLTFGGLARLGPGQGAEPEPVVEPQPEKAQRTDSKDLAAARAATRLPARNRRHRSSPVRAMDRLDEVARPRHSIRSVVERELPRVQQGPEQVFGRLAHRRGLFQLGRPVRQLLGRRRPADGPEIEVLDDLVGLGLELRARWPGSRSGSRPCSRSRRRRSGAGTGGG